MPSRSGGDPPQQKLLEIVDRQPPRGVVAESALVDAGFSDAKDAAKKLRDAGLDLTPSEDGSLNRKSARKKAEPKVDFKPREQPQGYTDEVDSGVSALPPRLWYRRRRSGPTLAVEFSLLDVIVDISRRYHLVKIVVGGGVFLAGLVGSVGPANKNEPSARPSNGWTIEIKPAAQ